MTNIAMKKQTLIIVLVLVALVALGAYVIMQKSNQRPPVSATQTAIPANAHVVTLTADGFQPAELSIKAGETVTFVTTAGKPFWPASNPHPSHTNYPEFDPQDPIAPTASWSFVFTKVGTWGYHDHLAPYFTGTITVSE
jgi:plastocyanin